jgi:hypothetical protein
MQLLLSLYFCEPKNKKTVTLCTNIFVPSHVMVTSDEVQQLGLEHNYTLCVKYYFMEPIGLLLCAQQPNSCPVLYQISVVHFNIPHLLLSLSSGLFS